ncbi:LuxR C-terminal-related transcriptional regulator [Citricoccus sp. NR2]|uniref:LuxR C-terminal-related transcriptional regulator n=1 Tax=Citricoccus sp. NR2 TaxID=3004095 RepID=UPI0022DE1621|nr:response regulator transcription factor [Citricoccus sp. NR2]WBL20042.1 response regulator transcription factor [Citricoccus sp. NR2]
MTASPSIRIALVDDQHLIRSGMAMLISSQPDLEVVAQSDNGQAALDSPEVRGADIVLMDIRMPVLDGIAATRALLGGNGSASVEDGHTPRVVVLTTFDLDEYALDAIDAGASGFLLKDAPPEELLAGIRAVHRGDAVIAPSTTRRLLDHLAPTLQPATPTTPEDDARLAAVGSLTPRENEVLVLMSAGLSNQEIAAQLFVSETTVKTHVGRVLHKLGARDRVQAVVTAYRTGVAAP